MKNSTAVANALKNLISLMETDEKKHKAEFAGQHLTDIFRLATYCSGKLFESVSDRSPIGDVGIGCRRDILANFEAALNERSPHFVEGGHVFHNLPILQHALHRFEEYVHGGGPQTENDAYILARYIQVELAQMADLAKEIDDEYQPISDRTPDETAEPNS
jgi:hypothetical protein